MENRLKKLLHRKKDDSDLHASAQSEHGSAGDNGLQQSLYEETATGVQPEIGGAPRHGNNPSFLPSQGSPYASTQRPGQTAYSSPASSNPPQDQSMAPRQNRAGEIIAQDFSRMSLEGAQGASPHGNQQRSSYAPSQDPFREDSSNTGPTGITREDMKNPQYSYLSSLYGPGAATASPSSQPSRAANAMPESRNPPQSLRPDASPARTIPRKEIATAGTPSTGPVSSSPAASASGHERQTSLQKPLPAAPVPEQASGGSMGYGPPGFRDTASAGQTRDMRGGSPRAPVLDPRVDGDLGYSTPRIPPLANRRDPTSVQGNNTAGTVLDPRVEKSQERGGPSNTRPMSGRDVNDSRGEVISTNIRSAGAPINAHGNGPASTIRGPREMDSSPGDVSGSTIRGPRAYGESFQVTSAAQNPASIGSQDPFVSNQTSELSVQEILERAKTRSKDTEVIERIAPAVVHETIKQDVHHVREEVVTREIHEHDVYHRILPIIDVEVLPPRHFLPVEGGGLVEVTADEVPGRRNNWVIAETASKIPSSDPAPKERRRFTAREFPGDEGDSKSYITPEGIERTEETWVHPPILETGARATGQTYPLPMDGKQKRKSHGYSRFSPTKSTPSKGILKQPSSDPTIDPEFTEGEYARDSATSRGQGV